MTLRFFCCTCFVQDLSPELDELSPRSIKHVFVRYSNTQKGYQYYNPSARKYFVPADVTFFESVPNFSPHLVTTSKTIPLPLSVSLSAPASADSSPVQLVDTSKPPALKSVRDFRYVYTHRQKVPVSELAPADPCHVECRQTSSAINISLTLISTLPFIKIISLALIILFQSSFLMIILTPLFISLLYPCLLSIYSGLMRKLY